MNPAYMELMAPAELDEYGEAMGIEMRPAKTAADKIALIERRRGQCAEVDAIGVSLRIPKKALFDKRVTELLNAPGGMSDEQATEALTLLIGRRQMNLLLAAATDEDGTVDTMALGVAFARILNSEQLKN